MSIFFGIEFHTSYLNYIAFIGLFVSTINTVLIINYNQYKNKQIKFIVNFLIFQLIQIYMYLAHLLSIKFELNIQSESNILHLFNGCCRKKESITN
jgi:hypothetical protein